MKKQKHRELEQIPPRLSVRRQQSQGQTRAGRSRGWCSNHCATLPVCAPSGFPGAVFTGWFVRVGWTVPQQEPSNLSSLKQQKFISCLCYMITEGQLTCQSSRQTGWPVWNTSSCHGRGERAPQLCLSSQKTFSRKWTWSLLLTFYWPKQGHFQGTWGVQFSHRERGTGGLLSLQGRHPWAAAGPQRTEPGTELGRGLCQPCLARLLPLVGSDGFGNPGRPTHQTTGAERCALLSPGPLHSCSLCPTCLPHLTVPLHPPRACTPSVSTGRLAPLGSLPHTRD